MNEEQLSIEANVRLVRGDDPSQVQAWLTSEHGANPVIARRVVAKLVAQNRLRARGLGIRALVKGGVIGGITGIGWTFNESLAEVWPVVVGDGPFLVGAVVSAYFVFQGARGLLFASELDD